MGAGRGVPSHLRHLGRRKTMESFPSANRECVRGSIHFYEGLVDDARHTMMLSRTAAHYGAAVASSCRVIGFLREVDRVAGVRVRDLETGNEFDIRAHQTINAAGVWIDELQEMLGGRGQFRVRASKGVHLLVPRNRINSRTGLITRTEKSLLFIIPWGSQLDHRHHRHRLGAGSRPSRGESGRHRLPAAAGEHAARRSAHPRRRDRGVRRAPAAAGRRVRVHLEAVPGARRRVAGPRADHDRRRQVHDLSGDGRRTRSTPPFVILTGGCPSRAPKTSRWSVPRAITRCGTRVRCWSPRPG